MLGHMYFSLMDVLGLVVVKHHLVELVLVEERSKEAFSVCNVITDHNSYFFLIISFAVYS